MAGQIVDPKDLGGTAPQAASNNVVDPADLGAPATPGLNTVPVQAAPTNGFFDRLGRQLGLGVRAAAQGITDPVLALNDMALRYVQNPIARTVGLPEAGSSMQTRDNLLNQVTPQPMGDGENIVNRTARAGYSLMLPFKGGQQMSTSTNPVVAGVGQTLTAAPGSQVAGAATGAAASETARTKFDVQDPLALLGIDIAGNLLGGGVASRASNVQIPAPQWMQDRLGIRNPVAGQNYQDPKVGATVQAARNEGVNLTAAEAAPQSAGGRAITGLRKAAGTLDEKADDLAASVVNMVERKTDAARPANATNQSVDRAVAQDLRQNYTNNKTTANKLFDAVETNLAKVPGSEKVTLGNTAQAAGKFLGDFPDWAALTNSSQTVRRAIDSVADSAAGREMTYSQVRKLNSEVGRLVSATRDDPKLAEMHGALKNLYANLQRDIDTWAVTTRKINPTAVDAHEAANSYFTNNVAPYRDNTTIYKVVSGKVNKADYDKSAEKLTERILSTGDETTNLATRLLSPEGNAAFRFGIMENARARGINPDAATIFSAPGYQRGMNLGRADTPTPQRTVMGTDQGALNDAVTTQNIIDIARVGSATSKAAPKTGYANMQIANRAGNAGVGAGTATLLGLDPTGGAIAGAAVAPYIASGAERILSTPQITDFLLGRRYQPGLGLLAPTIGIESKK